MPSHGTFLSDKEVRHLGYFLRCIGYSVNIPNHPLNKTDKKALSDFQRIFEDAFGSEDGDEVTEWPWYWHGADHGIYGDEETP